MMGFTPVSRLTSRAHLRGHCLSPQAALSCASQSRISTLLRIYPRTLSTKNLASVSGLPPRA